MDVFQRQEAARRSSRWLVLWFALALAGTIAAVAAAVSVVWYFFGFSVGGAAVPGNPGAGGMFDPVVALGAAAVTAVVVLAGSGYKTAQLSSGGGVIARDLGGQRVGPSTADPDEQRLVNVVEEMSIASGLPVPQIYVLDDEDSINAFAAGWTPSDAAVGVTRGALQALTRDELQGVVAHEFSHILNGDMRLNTRLVGLVFGLVALTVLGREALRMTGRVRTGGDRDGGKGVLIVLVLALVLLLLGWAGAMFAKLIKAGVSRQREFLADAAAVQFTRNPDGIGGALKKIGGSRSGSRLTTGRAEEASHLFFADGVGAFARLFATHPPLAERVRAILPHWDGEFPVVPPRISAGRRMPLDELKSGAAPPPVPEPVTVPRFDIGVGADAGEGGGGARLAEPTAAHLALANAVRDGLAPAVSSGVKSVAGAQAVVFALLLGQDGSVGERELDVLRELLGDEAAELVGGLAHDLAGRHSAEKLALVDLAVPALRRMAPEEYGRFGEVVDALMAADDGTSLFEYALQKVIRRHLDLYHRWTAPPKVRYQSVAAVAGPLRVVLGALAQLNPGPRGEAAFAAAAAELAPDLGGAPLEPPLPGTVRPDGLEWALRELERATPLVKKRFLVAGGRAVMADGVLLSAEAELLRAMADAVGVPVPPFIKAEVEGV